MERDSISSDNLCPPLKTSNMSFLIMDLLASLSDIQGRCNALLTGPLNWLHASIAISDPTAKQQRPYQACLLTFLPGRQNRLALFTR